MHLLLPGPLAQVRFEKNLYSIGEGSGELRICLVVFSGEVSQDSTIDFERDDDRGADTASKCRIPVCLWWGRALKLFFQIRMNNFYGILLNIHLLKCVSQQHNRNISIKIL